MNARGKLACALLFLPLSVSPATTAAESRVDVLVTELQVETDLSFDAWKASPDIKSAGIVGDAAAAPVFDDSAWGTLKIGESLKHDSCWLRRTIVLPERYLGRPISGRARILLSVDDAGTLWVDGERKGYFGWNGEFELTREARPGQRFALAIQAVNTGGPLRLLRARVELEPGAQDSSALLATLRDLTLSFKVGQKLLGFDTYQTSARNRVDPGTDLSSIPRAEKERLGAELEELATRVDLEALRRGDLAKFSASVESVRSGLTPITAFARRFTLHLAANAHIDAAWLWRERETVEVCRNTFSSVLNMFDARPDFTYTQSSAAYYDWMERLDPALFERIRARVQEGRWEVVGGMWVEPDCNLPSGDSWARHLLYGKRYFREKLGRDVKIGWNPDSFGYNWNMPQLYRNAGIDAFVTQKIGWNAVTVFPHRLFWWEAPDGSRVLSYFPFDYVSELDDPFRLVDWLRQFEANTGLREMLVLFGVGDHGGGPSLEMLARADRLARLDVFPRIAYGTAAQYLERLRASDLSRVPVWKDELYLEYHEGTFTTQAKTKELNRGSETLLTNAERFSVLAALEGAAYDGKALEEAWRNVLFNQFHDILPGSSIREVYVDAPERYAAAAEIGTELLDAALQRIAASVDTSKLSGTPLVVFNPLAWERRDLVRAPLPPEPAAWSVFDARGRELPSQIVATGRSAREILFVASAVPSLGYALFELRPQPASPAGSTLEVGEEWIQSGRFAVALDPASGWIRSLEDRRAGREILSGPGNRLQLLEDAPAAWDAWNIGLTGTESPSTYRGAAVVERGPVRAILRARRDFLKPGTKKEFPTEDFPTSFFTQDVILYDGLERVEFVTEVDWWEEHTMLKTAFPLAVADGRATYEIPFGTITRSTGSASEAERAKTEVPAQRFADLSQDDYGVSLLNRAKYGHDVLGSTLRLSLLRSPKWPDPTADRGRHRIEYALYPHPGRWREAASVRRAAEYNAPLLARTTGRHPGKAPAERSFVSLAPDSLVLSTLKQAEDSPAWIVQWYDARGDGGTAELTLPFTPRRVLRTNFLEEDGEPVSFQGSVVRVPTGKNAIVSLKVER